MKNVFLFLISLLIWPVSAREVISLNRSWHFTQGYETRKKVFTEVNLPHTYNLDALSGKEDYYRGLVNYEKSITIPETWEGKSVYIRFKGVNSVANVFVNGRHVGEHRGGYTAFVFDISKYLNYGKENTVWIRVNNAIQLDVMPLLGDFNMYGGIYRDVDLIVTEPDHIALTDYASSGVYLTQQFINKNLEQIDARVLLTGTAGEEVTLKIQIKDKQQQIVSGKQQTVTLSGEAQQAVRLSLEIKNPHLWQGLEDPYLYTVETELFRQNQLIDRVDERLGIRQYSVDPDKGFFLNGKHVQLRGVSRHQDREGVGNALYPIHHKEDIEIIREMGVNAIRLSHYPQDSYIYDLCDEQGIILWSEIPFVGPGGYRDKGFVDQESFKENGRQQLLEMIRQNLNHPAICFWGLFNELKESGDNPVPYLKELNELAHQEDPSRLTVSASNQSGEINRVTNLIAWNLYYGWYGGKPASIGDWADKTHVTYAGTPIGISEYGAGGSIYHQQEELKQPDANSYWHPENWQTYFHEEHWKAIDKRPFIWGTFVWNMFDFGAAHRTEGEVKGKNDKGLVTFDRKVRKDAFYFYKANWNRTDLFVYIAERRLTERSRAAQKIKVYSNLPEVELFVNGQSLGKHSGNYGIFTWENVSLQTGENTVTARAGKSAEDSIKLEVQDKRLGD
ncbi:MAG: glycoside hydrolase family 2 protein [Candidatus Symbiothrix sp.]|jgi:beta-galactosidase|nr:glycoside hydrolase family 2 protein [Candidatus Symbiothrix sp.]